ncbi:MAG: MYXO-CTERM domain-containing protein [Myxococcota bacterium]
MEKLTASDAAGASDFGTAVDGVGDPATFYTDADGDGFGDPDAPVVSCTQPSGTVSDATDCLDTDAAVYPGAEEIPSDGIDPACRALGWSCATTDAPALGWLLLLGLFCRRRPREP